MSARKLETANVRQPPSRRKAAKPAMARVLSIYDGQNFIGTVKVGADGGRVVAYDADGKRLGSFASVQAATLAFK
jgi:hypothetical protein